MAHAVLDWAGVTTSDEGSAELRELSADYEIIERLGRGSSAVVYRARDRALDRDVAIKLVHARGADDELLERAAQEARLLARLPHHPNIVAIYAVRQLTSGGLALVVQYVAGPTLREALRATGAFPPPRAARVLRDLARSLHFAHGHGIVHRDVKPENVYLDETTGRAMLSDFGAATLLHGDAQLTAVGAVIGTPAYMSPEQLAGGRVDGRSDLYALGLVGWELLTGLFPWGTSELYEILYRQRHTDLTPLDQLRPDLPVPLVNAVEGALERDPERRWPSAAEFLAALLAPPDAPRRPTRVVRATVPPTLTVGVVESQHAQPVAAALPTVEVATEEAGTGVADATSPAGPGSADTVGSAEAGPGARGAPPEPHDTPVAAPTHHPTDAARTHPAPRQGRRPLAPSRARRSAVAVTVLLLAGAAGLGFWGTRDDDVAPDASRTRAGEVALEQDLVADLAAAAVAVGDSGRPPASDSSPASGTRVDPIGDSPGPPSTPRAGQETDGRTSGASTTTPAPDATGPLAASDGCASPALADQRRCLLARLTEYDSELNDVYGRLIRTLRTRAGVAAGAPDPPAVRDLRVEQRAWLVERDGVCQRRARGQEGPLWAPSRARCLGELGAERARELAGRLERAG